MYSAHTGYLCDRRRYPLHFENKGYHFNYHYPEKRGDCSATGNVGSSLYPDDSRTAYAQIKHANIPMHNDKQPGTNK